MKLTTIPSKNKQYSLVAIALCGALFSCASPEKSHVEDFLANEIAKQQAQIISSDLTELPDSVTNVLLASAPNGQQNSMLEAEKYDINASGVDVVSFFAGLVKDTPFSVAIHPEVSGTISLDLKQVTLDQVFSLITDIYGYHIQKSDTIYRVFPAGMRTETFTVNYLMMQRDGSTQTSIISGGVAQGVGSNSGNSQSQQNNLSGGGSGGGLGRRGGIGLSGGNGTTMSTRIQTNYWETLETTLMTLLVNTE